MSGINKVIIIGNVGNDPEIRSTPSGDLVANMSVATSESWKDKQTQQKVEKTEWHRIVAFKRLAEIIEQYIKKGSKVYIEGKLQTQKWQDQNGQDRYTTQVLVNNLQMLDTKGANNEDKPAQHPDQRPMPPTDSFVDDIPF